MEEEMRAAKVQASMRRAGLILFGLALILAAGCRRPASTFAQLPAGTPTYSLTAKWVTGRGSQVFNARAYGATDNGTTDDTAAIKAAITGAGAGGVILFPPGNCNVTSELVVTTRFHTFEGPGARILNNQTAAGPCTYIGFSADAVNGITNRGLGSVPGPRSTTSSPIVDNAQHTKFVGGSSDGGITWLQNSDLTMMGHGNSIDWFSGLNRLTVSRSIIQALSRFGIRAGWSVDLDGWTQFCLPDT